MKLGFLVLLATCLSVQAKSVKNPFVKHVKREIISSSNSSDIGDDNAEFNETDLLWRNLIVGPPAGAPNIMLKVDSGGDGFSAEIEAYTKERQRLIEESIKNGEERNTERIIDVVENIDDGQNQNASSDKNQQTNGADQNGINNAAAVANTDNGPITFQPFTTSTGGSFTTATSITDIAKNQAANVATDQAAPNDSVDSGNDATQNNAHAPGTIALTVTFPKSIDANPESDANNADQTNGNSNTNNESIANAGEGQATDNMPEGNNETPAENNGADLQPIEAQGDVASSANVERNARNTNIQSAADDKLKSKKSSKYMAKTRGSMHVAELVGHINSVKSINSEPPPGTSL